MSTILLMAAHGSGRIEGLMAGGTPDEQSKTCESNYDWKKYFKLN